MINPIPITLTAALIEKNSAKINEPGQYYDNKGDGQVGISTNDLCLALD